MPGGGREGVPARVRLAGGDRAHFNRHLHRAARGDRHRAGKHAAGAEGEGACAGPACNGAAVAAQAQAHRHRVRKAGVGHRAGAAVADHDGEAGRAPGRYRCAAHRFAQPGRHHRARHHAVRDRDQRGSQLRRGHPAGADRLSLRRRRCAMGAGLHRIRKWVH